MGWQGHCPDAAGATRRGRGPSMPPKAPSPASRICTVQLSEATSAAGTVLRVQVCQRLLVHRTLRHRRDACVPIHAAASMQLHPSRLPLRLRKWRRPSEQQHAPACMHVWDHALQATLPTAQPIPAGPTDCLIRSSCDVTFGADLEVPQHDAAPPSWHHDRSYSLPPTHPSVRWSDCVFAAAQASCCQLAAAPASLAK